MMKGRILVSASVLVAVAFATVSPNEGSLNPKHKCRSDAHCDQSEAPHSCQNGFCVVVHEEQQILEAAQRLQAKACKSDRNCEGGLVCSERGFCEDGAPHGPDDNGHHL